MEKVNSHSFSKMEKVNSHSIEKSKDFLNISREVEVPAIPKAWDE